MESSEFWDFAQRYIYLKGRPITFESRPYLRDVYASFQRNLVLRCSRQVEKSTLLVNLILFLAATSPGIEMLFVCPRQEQARTFSNSRLLPALEGSPLLRRVLIGRHRSRLSVMYFPFENGSKLYLRSAFHSADPVRGLSADILFIDEAQDLAPGVLPVLQETLSHSRRGQIVITGTPKLIDNHLEGVFHRSTGCEWHVDCSQCDFEVRLDERAIGAGSLCCPKCLRTLDPSTGRWVANNPDATWGNGYGINHLMVPWLPFEEVLERQGSYDPVRFRNECLGLPTALGDHVITRAEVEACCSDLPVAESFDAIPWVGRGCLMAGIDWGGGVKSSTVMVLGYITDDKVFHVVRVDRFAAHEDPDFVLNAVSQRCRDFHVQYIGADGLGNGVVLNRLLLGKLDPSVILYGIQYAAGDQAPVQDGSLWRWTVGRSRTIGVLFGKIKTQLLQFPRIQDFGPYVEQFTCVLAEYDDHARTIMFTHPANQLDDAMHATNYAHCMGLRQLNAVRV